MSKQADPKGSQQQGGSLACPYCGSVLAAERPRRLRLIVCADCRRPVLAHRLLESLPFIGRYEYHETVKGAACLHALVFWVAILVVLAFPIWWLGPEMLLGFRWPAVAKRIAVNVLFAMAMLMWSAWTYDELLAVRTGVLIGFPHIELRGRSARRWGVFNFVIGVGSMVCSTVALWRHMAK